MGQIKTGCHEHITLAKLIGKMEFEHLASSFEQFTSNLNTRHLIWDLTEAVTHHINHKQIWKIVELGLRHTHTRQDGKIAIVAPNDFGHARQIELIADAQKARCDISCFKELYEAAKWIGICPTELPVPE